MVTYVYNIYRSDRNRYLDQMLGEAAFVWNHALALQKRYYSLYGGYIDVVRLQKHFQKRISRCLLGSQTVQELLQRLDSSYQRFFTHLAKRTPKFKKASHFSSFVFKQAGFKLNANILVINKINKHFKFSYSRPYEGKVKNVRVKRVHPGEYRLYIVTNSTPQPCHETHDGAMVGMDFGLKMFLTLSDGTAVEAPLWLKANLKKLRKLQHRHDKAQCKWDRTNPDGSHPKGARIIWESNHRKALAKDIARLNERISNLRDDWQWKVCHELCRRYDVLCIEDLNIEGMKRLWGRKVSDLAFSAFVSKLEQVASKYGCEVRKVDRYYASSRTCGNCGYVNKELTLRDREWVCPDCGAVIDRDLNAATNILRQGIASSGSPRKTKIHLRKGRHLPENLPSSDRRVCQIDSFRDNQVGQPRSQWHHHTVQQAQNAP